MTILLPRKHVRRSRGFGLVEVMVGMLIGMLGILVMLQVFQASEGQKRRTTGGSDALTGGAIAFYGIQRDVRQAGYGISNYAMFGCALSLGNGVTLSSLAPITINDPALANASPDANTDTLLVVYGSTAAGSPEGDLVSGQPSNTVLTVNTPTSFFDGDRIIAMQPSRPTPCNLQLDSVTHSGAYDDNPVTANITLGGGATGMNGGTLYDLGNSPKVIAYAVKGGMLRACDYMQNDCGAAGNANDPAVWVPIAGNIVSMRAMYGRDTGTPTMNGFVSQWDQTAPATQCDWARVAAVNMVLVAQNGQFEKTAVTTSAPTWAGSTVAPTPVAIDLGNVTNWQQYRYRTFQAIVPIRNVVWMGKPC